MDTPKATGKRVRLPEASGLEVVAALQRLGFAVIQQATDLIVLSGTGTIVAVPLVPLIDRTTLEAIRRSANVAALLLVQAIAEVRDNPRRGA